MRTVSLNARQAADAETTSQVEVVLLTIESDELDAPVRLSTDNTERLSDEPLTYGTRSTWMGADPETDPYLFILAGIEVPGDEQDVPAAAGIVIENVTNRIGKVLRGLTKPATVNLAVVFADTPDLPEVEYRGMIMTDAGGDNSEVRIEVSRRAIEDETVPMHRFTRQRFPGLIQ